VESFSWRRIYAVCERTGPGFWDEPVNAITNVAFLRVPWLAMPIAFLACWLIVDQWRGAVPWEWGWRWRSYGAALVLLVTVGALTLLRGLALDAASIRLGLHLLGAAALFTVSMIAATNDRAVCHILPIGLHPVWHVLNGATLYWLLRIAMTARMVQAIAGAGERERIAATPCGSAARSTGGRSDPAPGRAGPG
jgi:hypothetical protein